MASLVVCLFPPKSAKPRPPSFFIGAQPIDLAPKVLRNNEGACSIIPATPFLISNRMTSLVSVLSSLLSCEPKKLADQLKNHENREKVIKFLTGTKLQTSYKDREGVKKSVEFGNLSINSVSELYAFEGYLGNHSSISF